MLLTWNAIKNFDGHDNTAYGAASVIFPDASLSYRIEPEMRGNRVVYDVNFRTTGSEARELILKAVELSGGMVSLSPETSPRFASLDAAKKACERMEAKETGHVVTAAEAIADWAGGCKNTIFIEPDKIVQWIDVVPPDAIRAQLKEWLDAGRLKVAYGVESPHNGCLGHSSSDRELWSDPSKIPRVLEDTAGDRFRRDNGNLIEVYRKPDNSPISTGI